MDDKKLDRREFLKVTAAAVASTGLSHFRFLNFGGSSAASAAGSNPEQDMCMASVTGVCIPDDNCQVVPADTCVIQPQDTCAAQPLDTCVIQPQDTCTVPPVDTCAAQPIDTCVVQGVDDCDPTFTADTCVPPSDPDICGPGIDPEDICDPATVEADVCEPGFGPDLCGINYPQEPDLCELLPGDPDTSAVTLADIAGESTALPALGGLAALLAGAALWIRQRLSPKAKSED